MLFFRTIITFLRDPEYRSLLLTTSLVLALGTLVYQWLEGWSLLDAFYFSVITLTTIGYGDLAPVTDAGKLFTVLYIILSLGLILSFIHTVYEHYVEVKKKRKAERENS